MSGIRKYCDIADEDIQLIAMCKRERRAMREELKVLNKIDSNRVNKIYADERAKLKEQLHEFKDETLAEKFETSKWHISMIPEEVGDADTRTE